MLKVGMVIGHWKLLEGLEKTNPRKWRCKCTRCGRRDVRLAGHLETNTQPGCGKCRTAVRFCGTEAKKLVADRNNMPVTELELWALENCDDSEVAQAIVDDIIARETAIMRAERERVHAEALAKEMWRHETLTRPSERVQFEAMECEDDDCE